MRAQDFDKWMEKVFDSALESAVPLFTKIYNRFLKETGDKQSAALLAAHYFAANMEMAKNMMSGLLDKGTRTTQEEEDAKAPLVQKLNNLECRVIALENLVVGEPNGK